MQQFFSGTKFKISLCVCIALLLGIFMAAVSDSGTSPISSALSFVMTPLENAASGIAELMQDFSAGFVSAGSYKKQVQELQNELDEYKKKLVDYENLKYKLSAYENFLEVKETHQDFSFVPASVILRDASDVYGSITLNRGSDDGVKINDPVIYGSSLVGVVKKLSNSSCTVYTLLNPLVNVSAYEILTREDCYTEAENAYSIQGLIKLSGLSRSTPVTAGGTVCTSGIGGIYPKDLIIGTVREMVNTDAAAEAYAVIVPEVDPSSVTDVFIITDFYGKSSD